MKTLADLDAQRAIELRLRTLTSTDRGRWGSMSVHQMIVHLTEAYRCALGDKCVALAPTRIPRPIMKFAALRIPTRWPHGFPSPVEIAQDKLGKPPVEFAEDHAALLLALHDFCTRRPATNPHHPYFGPMSRWDWQRWGYLHADHHLRQFGR